MGITSSSKQINTDRIDCDGTLKVTLALSASPDIISNPTDIVLVLDRSGSMTGDPLDNMKAGARAFVDIIAEATGGISSGEIGAGSRIAIVSFSNTATVNSSLSTSVSELKDAIDAISAGGSTNHAAAFNAASDLLDGSQNAKVIVMFTDGKTTVGPDPSNAAASARANGIIIYCIGLIGSDGLDISALNDWATDPDASHVAITPEDSDLEELFKDLAKNISKTGATNIVINEKINPDFVITEIFDPTAGEAVMTGPTELKWTIPELGVSGNEGATLEFLITHTAGTNGLKQVNQEITYSDTEGNVVVFPDPYVETVCEIVVNPEKCPEPIELSLDGCSSYSEENAGKICMESTGSIISLNVTIKNVCPYKRSALGIILSEMVEGIEVPRGMKALTIPAHYYPECRDVLVKGIKFVLPDTANRSTCKCIKRELQVRFISHLVDSGYECC